MVASNLPRAEAEKASMGSRQPPGRFVSADRIGDLVAFLCGRRHDRRGHFNRRWLERSVVFFAY